MGISQSLQVSLVFSPHRGTPERGLCDCPEHGSGVQDPCFSLGMQGRVVPAMEEGQHVPTGVP